MSGGYEHLPADALEQLVRELQDQRRRLDNLEKPSGSQLSRYTYVSTGGVNDILNQTGTIGTTWLDSSFHPRVTFSTPIVVNAIVTISANGTVSNAGASSSSTMWAYVGYNYTGGDDGNTARSIWTGAYGSVNNPFGATFQDVVALEPGEYTFTVAAGYEHNGTNNGNILNNFASIAVSLQPA